MSAFRISMRKLKEILRLKYRCQLSHRQIAKSLSVSPSVVSRYLNQAAQLGIRDYPLSPEWNELNLRAAFKQTPVKKKKSSLPDWSLICQELKHKIMTLQLLYEEYQQQNPANHYRYAHFAASTKAGSKCNPRRCDKPTKREKSCSSIIVAPPSTSLTPKRVNSAQLRCLWRFSGRQITPMPKLPGVNA